MSTNSVTLSDTVRRQSANTSLCATSAAAAPVRWSVMSTAAYQSSPSIVTSMTPARSPNMNSGWPDEISSSSDLPCHGSARGEAAMTLKSPSVTASAKRPPMPPWSTVRSSMSRLAAARAGALVRQQHHAR